MLGSFGVPSFGAVDHCEPIVILRITFLDIQWFPQRFPEKVLLSKSFKSRLRGHSNQAIWLANFCNFGSKSEARQVENAPILGVILLGRSLVQLKDLVAFFIVVGSP